MLTMTRPMPRTVVPAEPAVVLEILKGVPSWALREIGMVERHVAKSGPIFLEGDPADRVWLVKEGWVKEGAYSANGRCLTLGIAGPGKLFGASSLGDAEYSTHAIAETDATVVSVAYGRFLGLMAKFPGVSGAVLRSLSKLLRHSKDMQVFGQESVQKRILHVLADLVEDFGTTIPLTKREIAEMAGTTVESSIRTFSRLTRQGLVSTVRGSITVRDLGKLKERLEGD